MEKRRTITYSEPIFDAIKVLNDGDRLIVYDMLNEHFLKGVSMDYTSCTDTVRSVLALLAPEIRKYKQKFEARAKASSCSRKISKCIETHRNASDEIEKEKRSKKENISHNIYNNINKYNLLYKQTTVCAHARETNKTNDDATELQSIIQNISASDPALATRFVTLVEELQKENERKINGKIISTAEIIAAYAELLNKSGAIELLRYTFNQIDNTPGIRNPFGYTVSLLYNIATGNLKNESELGNLQQREYTAEQLDSLFTNLDTLSA